MAHICDLTDVTARSVTQFGLVTTGQLDALGVGRQRRRTLEARGALERAGSRVWRLAGHPPTWHQRLLAALLEAGPDAAVSHMAACAWWRFAGIQPGAVEISVPRDQRPRRVEGLVHRVRDLGPADVDRRGRLPVTTPARSLLDAAPRLAPEQITDALDAATRAGLIDVAALRRRLDEPGRHGRRGVGRVQRALPPDREPRAVEDSWLERRLSRIIQRAGLPRPRCQVPIRHAGGTARVDFLYDRARLVVETDGHGSHATRRERQADAERDARLGALGFTVLRFTYEDVVGRPSYVVDTLRAFLLGTHLVGSQPNASPERQLTSTPASARTSSIGPTNPV
jgi:very-short-patch-repair endonuclease/predicted transcriptional regulator of viral defense system